MSAFVEFLIRKMQETAAKRYGGVPFYAVTLVEGPCYSTIGGSVPRAEIDWENLQKEIQAFEDEFKVQQPKEQL